MGLFMPRSVGDDACSDQTLVQFCVSTAMGWKATLLTLVAEIGTEMETERLDDVPDASPFGCLIPEGREPRVGTR